MDTRIPTIQALASKYDHDKRLSSDDLSHVVFEEINALLDTVMSDPTLQCCSNKRFYLRTDISGHGNGLLQPGDDAISLVAMIRETNGCDYEFELTMNGPLKLHPLAFAARKCVSNDK